MPHDAHVAPVLLVKPSLPLIDISGLRSRQLHSRLAVAQELKAACEQRGFFYITAHGIAPDVLQHIFVQSQQLFSLPTVSKSRLDEDAQSSSWIDAPPVPGTYVVNIGDLMARWTNGRYHSTLHRVVNVSGRERYSIAFFLTGQPDCEVACLPGCLAPGERPRYAPITVEQHLAECYRRTYA